VLYIVPWKRRCRRLVGRPASSLLDEVLSPIDRDVFERQVRYHSLIQAPPPDAGSGPRTIFFRGKTMNAYSTVVKFFQDSGFSSIPAF